MWKESAEIQDKMEGRVILTSCLSGHWRPLLTSHVQGKQGKPNKPYKRNDYVGHLSQRSNMTYMWQAYPKSVTITVINTQLLFGSATGTVMVWWCWGTKLLGSVLETIEARVRMLGRHETSSLRRISPISVASLSRPYCCHLATELQCYTKWKFKCPLVF